LILDGNARHVASFALSVLSPPMVREHEAAPDREGPNRKPHAKIFNDTIFPRRFPWRSFMGAAVRPAAGIGATGREFTEADHGSRQTNRRTRPASGSAKPSPGAARRRGLP